MAAATPISAILLAALLATGLYQLASPVPTMIGAGLALAAAAPLSFIAWQWRFATTGKRSHPVTVSVTSGFGCVMTLLGVHRYGESFQWLLICALAALCIWMAWQRFVWRREE